MTDPAIIPTVIISVLSILGGILLKLHFRKCKCGDAECKCDNNSENSINSPTLKNKIKKFFSNSNIENVNKNTNIDNNNINNNNDKNDKK